MNDAFYQDLSLIRADPYQSAAYSANGNTVVIAGPGSGKTRVLSLKAIQLIHQSIPANAGLACLSYSRETVRELRKRLSQYGYRHRSQDYIGTVHGFCLVEVIGPFQHLYPQYGIPQPLKIASGVVISKIYSSVLKDLDKRPRDIKQEDIDKERLLTLQGTSQVNTESNPIYSKAAALFEERLEKSGHIDFTQVAKTAALMIQEQEYIRKTIEARFPYLLIDEYQDLGKALHEMVLALHGGTGMTIYAVGDMDQSIFGFTGAYPDFLKELFYRDDFDSHQLKHNYRSNQGIIDASIAMLDPVPPLPLYESKTRLDELAEFTFIECEAEMHEQYICVADKLIPQLNERGIPNNEIVIIVGKNEHASEMAGILTSKGVPAYVAKWSFDSRSDVMQWLMECARWCIQPETHSFEELTRFWERLLQSHDDARIYWDLNQRKIELLEVLEKAREILGLLKWLEWVIGELRLGDVLNDSDRYPDEKENLKAVINEAKTGKLVNQPFSRLAKLSHPDDEITVITRHGVKGLEFEAVIMLGMEQGNFPWFSHQPGTKEYDEDKRVCYVSVSRAKKAVMLLYSKKITSHFDWGSKTFPQEASIFWRQLREKFGTDGNFFKTEDL
jgi:DNA helicase II / ATP-dependent DNA helicase PcrA